MTGFLYIVECAALISASMLLSPRCPLPGLPLHYLWIYPRQSQPLRQPLYLQRSLSVTRLPMPKGFESSPGNPRFHVWLRQCWLGNSRILNFSCFVILALPLCPEHLDETVVLSYNLRKLISNPYYYLHLIFHLHFNNILCV